MNTVNNNSSIELATRGMSGIEVPSRYSYLPDKFRDRPFRYYRKTDSVGVTPNYTFPAMRARVNSFDRQQPNDLHPEGEVTIDALRRLYPETKIGDRLVHSLWFIFRSQIMLLQHYHAGIGTGALSLLKYPAVLSL